MAAIDWLRATRPEIRLVGADVLADNRASHALFASVGFEPARTHYELRLTGSGARARRIQSGRMPT